MSAFVQLAPSTTIYTSYEASNIYATTSPSSATPFTAQDLSYGTTKKNNFLIGFIILCIFSILGLILLSILLSQRRKSQMASNESPNFAPLPQRIPTVKIPLKGTPTHGQESGQIRRPPPAFMGPREVSTPAHWFGQVPREPSDREEAARTRSLQAQARQGTPSPRGRMAVAEREQKSPPRVDKPLPPPPSVPSRGSSLDHLRETHDRVARREAQALSDARELFRFDF